MEACHGKELHPPDPGGEILHQEAPEGGGFALGDREVDGAVAVDGVAGAEAERGAARVPAEAGVAPRRRAARRRE